MFTSLSFYEFLNFFTNFFVPLMSPNTILLTELSMYGTVFQTLLSRRLACYHFVISWLNLIWVVFLLRYTFCLNTAFETLMPETKVLTWGPTRYAILSGSKNHQHRLLRKYVQWISTSASTSVVIVVVVVLFQCVQYFWWYSSCTDAHQGVGMVLIAPKLTIWDTM